MYDLYECGCINSIYVFGYHTYDTYKDRYSERKEMINHNLMTSCGIHGIVKVINVFTDEELEKYETNLLREKKLKRLLKN